jgi:hypothetical protein
VSKEQKKKINKNEKEICLQPNDIGFMKGIYLNDLRVNINLHHLHGYVT